ncbi:MAG: iolG [Chloroflexi bacterium]|jgi:myo-inositol 2-dehydrogenase/D-chiro-inositol 1-dehydrogenase|nr:iolG [Chloroflexota bacterium]
MIRFALIGAGFIGSVHARNLAAHPGIDFALVYDVDRARAETIAVRHDARVASSLDAIFTSSEIDAVFIASSTNTHAEYLERAAAAGKAILCEKPIDLALDRARSAVAAVTNAGVPAMINFNRRFDASHAELRANVAAGEAGKVEIIQMTSRGPSVPPLEYIKVSGGQMRDQTIHFFDLLRWIAQDDPVEVHVMGAALADPRVAEAGDVDTSIALLRMRSGALCQIDSARRTGYGYDERIEVFGSTGMVESGRQRFRGVSRYRGDKIVEDGLHAGWFERIEASYYRALDAFVGAVQGGAAPSPSLDDGLKAQIIAEAATQSLQRGAPVPINW